MSQTSKNSGKIAAIAGRVLLAVGLVAAAGLVAESQSPGGAAEVPSRLPAGFSGTGLAADCVGDVAAAGDMIGFSHSDGSGTQTITLVHTKKSWMAVYHIDKAGTLRLVSSREIDADFSLQLNATAPLPEEIRRIGRR